MLFGDVSYLFFLRVIGQPWHNPQALLLALGNRGNELQGLSLTLAVVIQLLDLRDSCVFVSLVLPISDLF